MRLTLIIILILVAANSIAQDALLLGHTIPEIVFEDEKEERERLFTPQQITSISAEAVLQSNPSNTADILQKNGAVMVQMSQSGGGSPIVRGFEANRVLLVLDGVRLNNAIFRSGHLQNIISTSPYMLDKMDVIFGPASVKYGSDALGGVIHIHTKSPEAHQATKRQFVQKINTANNGVSSHFDIAWSKGKWSFLQGISVQHYENLKMGGNRFHGYNDWGQEAHITDGVEQLNTSYSQADFMQKIRFDANQYCSIMLNTQASSSTNIPRFDKLNDLSDIGEGKFALWEYGPQKRFMNALSVHHTKEKRLFDEFNTRFAIQQLSESRRSQKTGGSLFERFEKVWVYSLVTDFNKTIGHNNLNYGFDAQHNLVNSTANAGTPSRYADGGSDMSSFSMFAQYKHPIIKSSYLSGGIRYSKNILNATFLDTETYNLPFESIQLDNDAITGSLGLFHQLQKGWEGGTSISSGFRSPNVDDVTKVFAKSGTVTVPNNDLTPEYSYNAELTISKKWNKGSYFSGTAFYTILQDAIVKDVFSLNGQDSLWYDGEYLQIVTNQNMQEAFVWGCHLKIHAVLNDFWTTTNSFNYTFGQDSDGNYMDHIPPMYGKSEVSWQNDKHVLQAFVLYNGWKHLETYSPNGSDNPQEATIDGTPSWWTLNLTHQYRLNEMLLVQVGLENILDAHYKTYSSGISAPGRNLILTLQVSF